MPEARSPRTLIPGNFWDWSLAWSYVKAVRQPGAAVDTLDWWRESLPNLHSGSSCGSCASYREEVASMRRPWPHPDCSGGRVLDRITLRRM